MPALLVYGPVWVEKRAQPFDGYQPQSFHDGSATQGRFFISANEGENNLMMTRHECNYTLQRETSRLPLGELERIDFAQVSRRRILVSGKILRLANHKPLLGWLWLIACWSLI